MARGSTTSFSSAPTTSATWPNDRGLRAVAEHRDRLAGERLPDEVGDHHAVRAGLPRTDGVEEAHDDDRQLAFLPVRQRQELVDRLAARVRPSMLRRRTQHEIRVLAERHVLALAVHLRRRRDDDELLLLVGVLQHDLGAVDVGFDRVHRLLDDQLDARPPPPGETRRRCGR